MISRMRLPQYLYLLTLVFCCSTRAQSTNSAAETKPAAESKSTIDEVRRLYDLAPVSATNPVLVRVKDCNIEIPASEFGAFINNDTPSGREPKPLTLEEKHQELQKLLDDYFWIWEGYSKKADQLDEISGLLKITRDDAMKAVLIDQEVGSRADSYEHYQKLTKELRQRIFDKAEIHVLEKGYDTLKAAARRVDEADGAAVKAAGTNATDFVSTHKDGLTDEERKMPVVSCKSATILVGPLIDAYCQLPLKERPKLENHDVFSKMLQDMLSDSLLLAEAYDRGIDKSEIVRTQVQSDRTGLVRQWAMEQVTAKADAAMKAPDFEERLQEWYKSHLKSLYTTTNTMTGQVRVITLAADRDLIQSDYFNDLMERMRADELKRLRQGHKIEINEAALEQLKVKWWAPAKVAELDRTIAAWNGDTREYTVKAGETNWNVSFTVTNVSPYELIIDDIHPVNEFISVQAPEMPWTVKPGEHSTFGLTVDLRNKIGVGHSPVIVETQMGNKTLTLVITYPDKAVEESPPAK
jgi:hypothetical protein